MKAIHFPLLLALLAAAVCAEPETFDDAMKRASADYTERLKTASEQLAAARKRIADEKAPLVQELRATEDRIVALQSQVERLEKGSEDYTNQRRKLISEIDDLHKSAAYLDTLAHDSLASFGESLSPGEGQIVSDKIQSLQDKLDDTSSGPNASSAIDIAEFLIGRVQLDLGGHSARGSALIDGSNEVVKGTFAYIGPETFFVPDAGPGAGTVRPRSGSVYPVTYPLAEWTQSDVSAFVAGRHTTIIADPSGGKALRLRETKGTVLDHVKKGGAMAFFIVGVGALALLMIAQKIFDLRKLSLDSPQVVQSFLALVSNGDSAKAEVALRPLRPPTRELFTVGLRYGAGSKEILEEHLQAVLLRQRLHFERRLPLLAVIATAAPLMGLLGTVVGMVKTFALITVFGTGNAAKLASGISEVLVATELGLIVAIPTLIAHGFLAHRIQKNLSLLERYALEFVTAATTAKGAGREVGA